MLIFSAHSVLHEDGEVYVSLCKGQGGTPVDQPREWHDTWQVVAMAACANLILNKLIPFSMDVFPQYSNTGFRYNIPLLKNNGPEAIYFTFLPSHSRCNASLYFILIANYYIIECWTHFQTRSKY